MVKGTQTGMKIALGVEPEELNQRSQSLFRRLGTYPTQL